MNRPSTTAKTSGQKNGALLQSGVILSAGSFLVGLGNFAFQAIIGHKLKESGEYGLVNTTLGYVGLLGLPPGIATTASTHYIAHFHFSGADARRQGRLAGCRKFLFRLTITGSLPAMRGGKIQPAK